LIDHNSYVRQQGTEVYSFEAVGKMRKV